jgi:penicillin amidase
MKKALPGPNGAIVFERDALGYPTILARDLVEGSYALGYLHARDRLVQVTLTELAARGRLMSVLGDVPFARLIDTSVRAIGLVSDLAEQARKCDPETRRVLAAYVSGFNAGARSRRKPWLLRLLRVPAFECSIESMIALFRFIGYFGLTSQQLSAELIVAELAAKGAPSRVFQRLLGAKASGLDLDALRRVSLPPELSFFETALKGLASPPTAAGAVAAAVAQGASPRPGGLAGSNAFAVSGERSASGGALLMGEFHLEVGRFPPLAYAAHLALSNGDYLSGITIPGMSWFAAGRTPRVGWSYTFAHADNVDLVVERVKGGCYELNGEYHPLRPRPERVEIRGRSPETWLFHDNDYGTVLGDVEREAERVAVRVSGLKETYRAFAAARRQLDCQSVEELLELQREVRSVSLEAIMADHHGNIASIVTGQIDQRPAGWNGAYPVARARVPVLDPAAVSESERPLALRPESGVLVSANQGGQGPERDRWCNNPEPHYRFQRIGELLSIQAQHRLESLLAISYDTFDASARRLLEVWAPLMPDHPLARALEGWSTVQRDRTLLSLYYRLHEEVSFALLAEDIGRASAERFRDRSSLVMYQHQLDALLALEQPESLNREQLRVLLAGAFARAVRADEPATVPVRLRFRHLLTQGKSPAWLGFDSPELELPGTPVSPFQCRMIPAAGETLVYAPAFHLLFDMSWSDVWYNLPGGASESRLGPGYGKGVSEWMSGALLPLGRPRSQERLQPVPPG